MHPFCFTQEEGNWDEQSQSDEMERTFVEGIEVEPDMPKNIPSEVDPQVCASAHILLIFFFT